MTLTQWSFDSGKHLRRKTSHTGGIDPCVSSCTRPFSWSVAGWASNTSLIPPPWIFSAEMAILVDSLALIAFGAMIVWHQPLRRKHFDPESGEKRYRYNQSIDDFRYHNLFYLIVLLFGLA